MKKGLIGNPLIFREESHEVEIEHIYSFKRSIALLFNKICEILWYVVKWIGL